MHRIRNVKWQSNNRSSEQPQYHSCTYVNDYSSDCLVSLLTSECLTVPGEPTDQWMSHCAWWAHWPVNVSLCLVSQLTSECLTLLGEPTDQWMPHCARWANWPVNVSPCLVSLLTSECLTLLGEPTDQWMSHCARWAHWPVNVSLCLVSLLIIIINNNNRISIPPLVVTSEAVAEPVRSRKSAIVG